MPDPIIANTQLVEDTFDGAASGYDGKGVMKKRGQRLVDLLDIKAGARVLDVATGRGAVLLPAARRVGPGGRVTGIDISSNMLEQAKKAAVENGVNHVDLIKMDAEHLEFPDAFFDIITCGFGIWFFSPTGLDEMYRVCKPGGAIGVSIFGRAAPDAKSPSQILNQLLREFGREIKWTQQASLSPEEIVSLLSSHRFRPTQTIAEKAESVLASPEEYWEERLSSPSRLAIMSMDDSTRGRFKEELFRRLRSVMESDGLHFSGSIIYSIAEK